MEMKWEFTSWGKLTGEEQEPPGQGTPTSLVLYIPSSQTPVLQRH